MEEEEELDEQFRQAADQVSIGFFISHPEFSKMRCALTFIFFQLDRLQSVLLCGSDFCYNEIFVNTCRPVLTVLIYTCSYFFYICLELDFIVLFHDVLKVIFVYNRFNSKTLGANCATRNAKARTD